jgi:hypothetical protein
MSNATVILRQYGPNSFEDAQLIRQLFLQAAQRAVLETDAEQIRAALLDLDVWGNWLLVAQDYFRAECRRRERTVDPFYVSSADADAIRYLAWLDDLARNSGGVR